MEGLVEGRYAWYSFRGAHFLVTLIEKRPTKWKVMNERGHYFTVPHKNLIPVPMEWQ